MRDEKRRRRGRNALWFGLVVVLAVIGGRWLWRQVQFTRLRGPLIQAVRNNNSAEARALLEQGADPNVCMDYVAEPLTWTTLWQTLRGKVAGVGVPRKKTVLMEAVEQNEVAIVDLLLEHGADTGLKNDGMKRWDALHYATRSDAVTSMRSLLKHGARVDAKDGNGNTALMYAISTDAYSKSNSSETSVTRLLLQFGADVNVQNVIGTTPLMVAASNSRSSLISLLLQQGADPNLHDTRGNTALMYALVIHGAEVGTALLQGGAKIDLRDSDGRTALMRAVATRPEVMYAFERKRYLAWIRVLLAYGANVQLKDNTGKTALQLAMDYHEPEVVALLRKAAIRASGADKPAWQ